MLMLTEGSLWRRWPERYAYAREEFEKYSGQKRIKKFGTYNEAREQVTEAK
jgi:hypothetical protein